MKLAERKKVKALALLSGGLDSTLAVRVIQQQGIEVIGINFLSIFCTCTPKSYSCLASKKSALQLGIELKVIEFSQELIEAVKHPRHGYGSQLNPCLDCRIAMFKKAGQYMREMGAEFIITGEVLGERPMSQRKDAIRIIEKESGLEGLILRPLSAKLFPPTPMERKGWIEREELLSIQGRSRRPQIRLAQELGINDYPCPSGGCLLTDPGFARRMRDLLNYLPEFELNDARLLKLGRHFRLNKDAKLVVGRNKLENEELLSLLREGDVYFYPLDGKGPLGIGRGRFGKEEIQLSASIVSRYSDGSLNKINCKIHPEGEVEVIETAGIEEEKLNSFRI